MFKISSNGIITLTHGDYATVPLFINANKGNRYEPVRYILQDDVNERDKIYFAIMTPNTPFTKAEIRKIYTRADINAFGDVVITLNPEDTENLLPGLYYYEVKLSIQKNNKEYIETIIGRRKFYLI